MQTVPYILGIAYPTGFPGYILIGWVWSHVVVIGGVAERMNALSAVATASSAAIVAFIAVGFEAPSLVALAAALLYAGSRVIWTHATYADVHPLGVAVAALALAFALRWQRDGRWRDAVITAAAAALALGIDNTTVLMLPGIAMIAFARRPPLVRTLALCAGALVVVAALYAYLPLRSASLSAAHADPTLALGIAPGRPFWDDHHPVDPVGFVKLVTGSEFGAHHVLGAMFSTATLARVRVEFGGATMRDLGQFLALLAIGGAIVWSMRDPSGAFGIIVFGAFPLLFFLAYPAEADTERYYAAAYLAMVVLAASLATTLARSLENPVRFAAAITGAVFLAFALSSDASGNRDQFANRYDRGAGEYVARVTRETPPNAIVVALWLYATPLAYHAYVERAFANRILVTGLPLDYASSYRAWMRQRPVVIVSDDPVDVPGLRTRELGRGSPHLWQVVR